MTIEERTFLIVQLNGEVVYAGKKQDWNREEFERTSASRWQGYQTTELFNPSRSKYILITQIGRLKDRFGEFVNYDSTGAELFKQLSVPVGSREEAEGTIKRLIESNKRNIRIDLINSVPEQAEGR